MKYFIADAFTDKPFFGNPAGVCLLDHPIEESLMQKIAFENNLAETAFLIPQDHYYDLRWFTPEVEIDLCGHATLASSFILMNYVDTQKTSLEFHTQSGILTVKRKDDLYLMDFPRRKPAPCEIPAGLSDALGCNILETHQSRDILVLVESETVLATLTPDFIKLMQIGGSFAVIVTAKSQKCDFVSRFFAPNAGINEDPVTGSSHSTLIPFWSGILGKNEMVAAQLSKRGGVLYCTDQKERVTIGGKAVCYMAGNIVI